MTLEVAMARVRRRYEDDRYMELVLMFNNPEKATELITGRNQLGEQVLV